MAKVRRDREGDCDDGLAERLARNYQAALVRRTTVTSHHTNAVVGNADVRDPCL